MSRVLRSSLHDGYFHVYCRGVSSSVAFTDDHDRAALFERLWHYAQRHRWVCYAACVLSTHYHLVLEATIAELSTGMRALNGTYARYFNRRHSRFGHVFAERYSTRMIESEDRVFDTCAYVLLNPVKAGLCNHAEDWPWSFNRFEGAGR